MLSVFRGRPGAQDRPDGCTLEIRVELVVSALCFIFVFIARSDAALRWQRWCTACRIACIMLWFVSLLYSVWVLDLAVETKDGAMWLLVYGTPGPAGRLHYIGEAVSILFHLCVAAAAFVCDAGGRRALRIRALFCAVIVGMMCSLGFILPFISHAKPAPTQPRALELYVVSRMGNNLIQWLFARIDADRSAPPGRYHLRSHGLPHKGYYRAKVLLAFPNIKEDSYGRLDLIWGFARWMDRARGLADAAKVACPGDDYKQVSLLLLLITYTYYITLRILITYTYDLLLLFLLGTYATTTSRTTSSFKTTARWRAISGSLQEAHPCAALGTTTLSCIFASWRSRLLLILY